MFKLVISVAVLAVSLPLGAVPGQRRPAVPLGQAAMILEWSPGKEAVVRITAEPEEELERVRIQRPDGQALVDLNARTLLARGFSSLELELPGPTLEALIQNYAEGSYGIRADTVGGRVAVGSAQLSFDLPAAPRILHPRPQALVAPSGLMVSWLRGRDSVGYELEIEQGENDGLRVRLPPEQSQFQVPSGFLRPGTETTLEIAAIGANGNRTLTEVRFVTRL